MPELDWDNITGVNAELWRKLVKEFYKTKQEVKNEHYTQNYPKHIVKEVRSGLKIQYTV